MAIAVITGIFLKVQMQGHFTNLPVHKMLHSLYWQFTTRD